MGVLLRIDALNVTETGHLMDDQDGLNGYAVWFFLDKDQSCFVEMNTSQPSRQPEFFIKNGHKHSLLIELFRKKSKDAEERVLIGEAVVSTGYLVGTPESQLIIELLRGDGHIAANILLKIEKLDSKGRSLSQRSSRAPSQDFSQSSTSIINTIGTMNGTTADNSSDSSSFIGDHLTSASSVYQVNPYGAEIASINAPSLKMDFLQKFTLSGSPVTIVKSSESFIGEPPSNSASPEPSKLATIVPLSRSAGIIENHDNDHADDEHDDEMKSINDKNDKNDNNDHDDDALVLPPIPSHFSIKRASSPTDVKGIVSLEIVAAQNLPREKRFVRVHYANNPFVVISFGKQSFRTRVVRRTLNPVWKERCFFTVKGGETKYHVTFSVYDYEKFSYNACTGTASLQAGTLLDHPNEIQKLALPLRVVGPNAFADACLLVKACFISYDVLRKNFWEILAKQYDHDDNGRLNRIELSTMLATIGSTLSDDTIDAIIKKLDVDVEGEIAIDNIVSSLEALTVKSRLPEHEEENIVLIRSCPICNRPFTKKGEDIDAITHLAICAAQDAGKLDRLMMGGFLTEDYASRKWFMRIISFMGFGGYRLGRNNGNILVQDRKTGKLLEEKMPTYIRLGIRWLHQYAASNRAVDSSMVRQIFQTLTIKQGKKFDDPLSIRNIPDFIRYHHLNIDEIAEPICAFKTFNEFFYRKLKHGSRVLADPDARVAVSPADCRMNVFPTIKDATRLWIKGSNFSIPALLKDEQLASYYEGGSVVVCRLAPQDYHRFHSPVDGQLTLFYHIPGTYFTVNPMAVRQKIDVYTENSRTVCMLDSTKFGKVAFIAIGAMMVGSIIITATGGSPINRMDELGYFAFGGSTIVVLFPPNVIEFDHDLLVNSGEQLETLVQVGNSLGLSNLELTTTTAPP